MDQPQNARANEPSGPGTVTQLLHRLEDGDRTAVTQLWGIYGPRVLGRAKKLLQNSGVRVPDVESVAQEVFLELCGIHVRSKTESRRRRKPPHFEHRHEFSGWMLNAAKWRGLDQARKELAQAPLRRLGLSCEFDQKIPGVAVVLGVTKRSPAAQAGFLTNDQIYSVCGEHFRGKAEFQRLLSAHHGPWEFVVNREGRPQRVVVKRLPPRTQEFGQAALAEPVDVEPLPDHEVENEELLTNLAAAIAALPERPRRVFQRRENVLITQSGKARVMADDDVPFRVPPFREIAAELGLESTEGARWLYRDALRKLRENLERLGVDPTELFNGRRAWCR
ncbi:MAG TPA: PDZ domain-containing protein [Pirellulales bacterium]|nr:PDZ domain-containing protein [Pirellulales bacterium]